MQRFMDNSALNTYVLISLLLLTLTPVVIAHNSGAIFQSGYTSEAPKLDGIINDDEWAAADSISFTIPEGKATIFIMNDRRSIYFGAIVEDDSLDEIINVNLDIFTVDFDNDHDGASFIDGEDTISLGARARHGDAAIDPAGQILDDNQTDVDRLVGRVGNFNHYEMAHPISSNDVADIQSDYGETIGVRFLFFDGSGSDNAEITVFPKGVSATDSSQANWADIVIAVPPAGEDLDSGVSDGSSVVLPLLIITAVGWAAYFGYAIRKRRMDE